MAISRKDRKKAKGGAASASPCFALLITLGPAPKEKKKPLEVAEGGKAREHLGKRRRGGRTDGGSVDSVSHAQSPFAAIPPPPKDDGDEDTTTTTYRPNIQAPPGLLARVESLGASGTKHASGGRLPDGMRYRPPAEILKRHYGGRDFDGHASGGRLTAGERQSMPSSDFALPGKGDGPKGAGSGSYPVNDRKHGRLALAMVSAHGSAEEKAAVRAKVHSKYPDLGGD